MAKNNKKDKIYTSIDDFYKNEQFIGSVDKAIGNTLYGFDHQNIRAIVPENRETFGYTFFTRPQLNMESSNIRNNRKFYSLLTTDNTTTHSYVRNMLDPRLARRNPKHKSLLIDNNNPFIPLLSNTVETVSGFPDTVLRSFTSQAGIRGEQWAMGDSYTDIYEVYDLDATFRNIKEEPILLMMQMWVDYIALVYDGTFSPYLDMITENEIDYNTRIYRLIMDETEVYVKKIYATGASYPINVPTGKSADFNKSAKYNLQSKELNFRFKSHGLISNDDILLKEFNHTVCIFNSDMKRMDRGKGHNMAKIPARLKPLVNFRGIPYINKKTLELEWWISKASYAYKRLVQLMDSEGYLYKK